MKWNFYVVFWIADIVDLKLQLKWGGNSDLSKNLVNEFRGNKDLTNSLQLLILLVEVQCFPNIMLKA